MLLNQFSVLQSDSKVRTIKVCYEDRAVDQSLFSLQLEVWSRSTDEAMKLSNIGHENIVKDQEGADCDELTPREDYVITEFMFDAHKKFGITYIKVTFSEDYGVEPASQDVFGFGAVDDEPAKQEIFEFGRRITDMDNVFVRIDDLS